MLCLCRGGKPFLFSLSFSEVSLSPSFALAFAGNSILCSMLALRGFFFGVSFFCVLLPRCSLALRWTLNNIGIPCSRYTDTSLHSIARISQHRVAQWDVNKYKQRPILKFDKMPILFIFSSNNKIEFSLPCEKCAKFLFFLRIFLCYWICRCFRRISYGRAFFIVQPQHTRLDVRREIEMRNADDKLRLENERAEGSEQESPHTLNAARSHLIESEKINKLLRITACRAPVCANTQVHRILHSVTIDRIFYNWLEWCALRSVAEIDTPNPTNEVQVCWFCLCSAYMICCHPFEWKQYNVDQPRTFLMNKLHCLLCACTQVRDNRTPFAIEMRFSECSTLCVRFEFNERVSNVFSEVYCERPRHERRKSMQINSLLVFVSVLIVNPWAHFAVLSHQFIPVTCGWPDWKVFMNIFDSFELIWRPIYASGAMKDVKITFYTKKTLVHR